VKVISEALRGPIGLAIVKNIFKIWNEVEMSVMGEVITPSGFCESYYGSPKTSYRTGYSEKPI